MNEEHADQPQVREAVDLPGDWDTTVVETFYSEPGPSSEDEGPPADWKAFVDGLDRAREFIRSEIGRDTYRAVDRLHGDVGSDTDPARD